MTTRRAFFGLLAASPGALLAQPAPAEPPKPARATFTVRDADFSSGFQCEGELDVTFINCRFIDSSMRDRSADIQCAINYAYAGYGPVVLR